MSLGVIQQLRGQNFAIFRPPPLRGQFLYPERGQKQTFFDPLPPSSGQAWTLADSGFFLNFLYQGGVKSTVSWVFEDLKFKISEGSDPNWFSLLKF